MSIRMIQSVLILIPFGIFFWLVRIELVPNGVFSVPHEVNDSSPYIDALAPQDRVDHGQTIINDPVFFFVHPHRQFDRVAFEIWFQNTTVPIVEFGGLVQTKPEVYELQPLHNLLIDQLGWPTVSDGQQTLHQKQKRYETIEAFYADPPARENVAVYKADYQVPFRLAGYAPSGIEQSIDVTLRGKHELKTYIKQETLDVRFFYMDMNRDEGADPVVVTVFDERGQPVAEARAEDDGRTRGDAIPSHVRTLELRVPGLAEGVYKIVMNASRDIFFRTLKTTQSKLIFLHSIYLGDEIAYREDPRPVEFWSASKRVRAQTRHAEGVQNLTRGQELFSVAEPYKMYTFETNGSLDATRVPKGDLELYVDGPLAFSKAQYFQPDPMVVRPYVDLEAQGIEYVLTSYQSPKEKDGWLVQTIESETSPLVFEKKSWKFTFSTPEIRERGGEVRIKEINTTFTREPFVWSDVWNWIKR